MEIEVFRLLGAKWRLTTTKLYAFNELLYARGAHKARNIDITVMEQKMESNIFLQYYDFTEVMKLIRSDNRNQQSQRLQIDKFVLISEVWRKIIEHSQNCYTNQDYIYL